MEVPRNPNVDPSELYEGPQPGANVTRLAIPVADSTMDPAAAKRIDELMAPRARSVPIAETSRPARDRHDYTALLVATVDVLNTRLLALLAVIAACAMWGLAVYHPDSARTWAALAFSGSVLLPLVVLHWKQG